MKHKILFIIGILLLSQIVASASILDTKKPESISFDNGIQIDSITIVRKGDFECLDIKISETIKGAYEKEIPEPVRLILKSEDYCWLYNPLTYKEEISIFIYLIEYSKADYILTNDDGKIYDFNKKTLVEIDPIIIK